MKKKLDKEHYESLVGMLKHYECDSQEIDQICKYAISRPIVEKEFFDLFEKQKRMSTLDPQISCCLCVDQIVDQIAYKIILAMSKK